MALRDVIDGGATNRALEKVYQPRIPFPARAMHYKLLLARTSKRKLCGDANARRKHLGDFGHYVSKVAVALVGNHVKLERDAGLIHVDSMIRCRWETRVKKKDNPLTASPYRR